MAELHDVLELIVTEITEATAADVMLSGYARHHDELAELPLQVQQVFGYVEQSVAWKLCLAINRLLQPMGKDRASLERFFKLVGMKGVEVADHTALDRARAAFERMRALPEVSELRLARDSFMAHALLPPRGKRDGIKLFPIRELFAGLADVVEGCYYAVNGRSSVISEHHQDWIEWSDDWWRYILTQGK